MATIKKPDANPVAALLLTLFVFNLGHLIINGQQKKFIYTLVACILTCWFLLGLLIGICSVIDAYQTAERLQKGEEIDENEYSMPLLYSIMKIVDKTATCKAATPA